MPDPSATIHLINPLRNRWGGSERRTIETWRMLRSSAPVQVWCARDAAPELRRECAARVINPLLLSYPRTGTLVFVGTYFSVGRWIAFTHPQRVVVIFNTDQPRWLRDNLARIASSGCAAEVVYTSHALRNRHRGVGAVLESPVALDHFPFAAPTTDAARQFTIGRYSRDDLPKHHADDPALWRTLAAEGFRVRLMGATCLAPYLADVPGIELLPAGTEPPLDFLRSLDAFAYRTADNWFEAFGRVIFEAMAAGTPVICGRRGGYADYLTHGHTALLGDDTRTLLEHARTLRDNHALTMSLATNARQLVERMHGGALRRMTHSLLVGTPVPALRNGDEFQESQPVLPGD